MQLVNENTGYAICEGFLTTKGYIYKTTNGGVNWFNLVLPSFMNTFLWELDFLDANTGYVCGHAFHIFKTSDGGYNWDTLIPPRRNNMQTYGAIQFLNEQNGYIGGRYGMVSKTTNAGLNWIFCDTAFTDILDMHFLDLNTGYLVDSYSGVYKTTNGSITWNYQYLTDTSSGAYLYAFQKIKFINYNTGYIVGARVNPNRGAIFKTTNGGNNWKSILITPNNPLYSLEVVNSSAIYVGSQEKIVFKSTDDGKSWISQQLPTYWGVTSSVVFINLNTGFCCAGNEIMKTTNGGSVFVKNISSEIPDGYRLFQNYPNPFNPVTKINYELPIDGLVKLVIYDILGREIKTLVNELKQAGRYTIEFNGSNFASGIYFYRIQVVDPTGRTGSFVQVKRMVLVK